MKITKKSKFLLANLSIIFLLNLSFYFFRGNRAFCDWILSNISIPIREFLGFLTNFVPFSLAEFLYVFLVIFSVFVIFKLFKEIFNKKEFIEKVKILLEKLVIIAVIPLWIWTGYSWLWAIGYSASSFAEQNQIYIQGISVEDLEKVTKHFAQKASEYSVKVERNSNGYFVENDFWSDISGVYKKIQEDFPSLNVTELKPKKMIFSKFMSVLGFTGFYFPITGEANVNVDFPAALQPQTIAHEMAHQRRINSEAEANFVSIAACVTCDKIVYNYSGYLAGLTHLSNALYAAKPEAWAEISKDLSDFVRLDWQENSFYWKKFESPVETAATTVYDNYLKHNQQESGMKSYGECVDLLVEYFKDFC